MFRSFGNELHMTEGDYGVGLPLTVRGLSFGSADWLRFAVKAAPNGETLLEKSFADIDDNRVTLTLTAAESALLPPGRYVWTLDWLQEDSFLCCLMPGAAFVVEDKA